MLKLTAIIPALLLVQYSQSTPLPYSQVKPWLPPAAIPGTTPGTRIPFPSEPMVPQNGSMWPSYRR